MEVRGSLLSAFAATLGGERWDVALLQEAPPRWLGALCSATGAAGVSALTSRNLAAPMRAWMSERRPDLLRSWEGGSNQLLVRRPWRVAALRRVTLTRRPERRRMLWAAIERPGGEGVAVACLHASISGRGPERDVARAAEAADALSRGGPLLLGGDLNLRPRSARATFALLRERHGLDGTTAPDAIDHLLSRGLEVADAAHELPPARREIGRPDGRLVRLSDHAQVVASYFVK